MNHLGPEECPLCWRFDCKCWQLTASGMSAFGQDAEERLEAKPASPVGEAETPKRPGQ